MDSLTVTDSGWVENLAHVVLTYTIRVHQCDNGDYQAMAYRGKNISLEAWDKTRAGALARIEKALRVRHEVPANG